MQIKRISIFNCSACSYNHLDLVVEDNVCICPNTQTKIYVSWKTIKYSK